ncbi:DMT family transporter [Desulfopila sp. IMCC35008]|uniref:DMT family transporter n=1 Tax=Desulfopila sp. IMCC35008 TaxID=2653858 RepID=UPI0013D8BAE2|nr:DMT family transporter [Desulfopila sp. IMCC35008]
MTFITRFVNSALPDTTKGIALALVSNALFVVVGVCVRYLNETIDVFQILFFRQLVFMTVLIPAIWKNLDVLMKPRLIQLHSLRIIAAFFALQLGFVTVSNMPLAEATALGFTTVLFVALISGVFLKESIGKSRQFTLIAGFTGVILVVQPSFEKMTFVYILTGLGAAMAAAVAIFCVRKIASTESTITLLVYQALFVGLLAFVPSLLNWQWPTADELTLLMLVGSLSSIAQWFGVTAYKYGAANVVSNVEYTKMIYSLLLGYLLFSEIPDMISLVGAAVIITSVLLPYFLAKIIGWQQRMGEIQAGR